MRMLWRRAWQREGIGSPVCGIILLWQVREGFAKGVTSEPGPDWSKPCWIQRMNIWGIGNSPECKGPDVRICFGCVQATMRRQSGVQMSEELWVRMRFQEVPGWPDQGEPGWPLAHCSFDSMPSWWRVLQRNVMVWLFLTKTFWKISNAYKSGS